MNCTAIDLTEYTDSFIGVGNIENEVFTGIVLYEGEFVLTCDPIELNAQINEAYKMLKNMENIMVVVV